MCPVHFELADGTAERFVKRMCTRARSFVCLLGHHAQVLFTEVSPFGLLACSAGLAAEIPEDLYMLIKKAVAVRKHLERNRRDKDSKFRLILIESRIHRLARYYRTNRKLAANWKYESASASALVA